QFLRQRLVKSMRQAVDRRAFGVKVVGTHYGRVAAGISAADPAFFQHGHIGDAVVPGQIVGRSEAVAAPANDNGIVAGPWLWGTPGRLPARLSGKAFLEQRKRRVASGHAIQPASLRGYDRSGRCNAPADRDE